MMQILMVLWVANRKVYGAHKLWKAAGEAGHDIGRDQVARLMRSMEDRGRCPGSGSKVFTTRQDPDAVRAPDLVNRNFTADRPEPAVGHRPHLCPDPDRGWRTCASSSTRSPVGSSAGGWRRTCEPRWSSTRSEMARRSRGGRRLVGLVTHSDAGSQFTSVRFTERLDEIGARPSIGTIADSYDNALAETTNGLYKTECVHGPDAPRPWDDVDAARARDPVVGALVQRGTPPQPLRLHVRPQSSKQRSTLPNSPTPTGVGNQ